MTVCFQLGWKLSIRRLDAEEEKAAATETTEMFVKPEDEVTKEGYKHFLNPGQVLQRALRQFSSTFISDFYHAWLYLVGENPRVEGNPRIMAVFEKAKV